MPVAEIKHGQSDGSEAQNQGRYAGVYKGDDDEVGKFGIQLAPTYPLQTSVLAVPLSWRLVDEPVVKYILKEVGVIENVLGGGSKSLQDEIGQVEV